MIEPAGGACATVAQSVEQLIRNQQVTGSNPVSSSKKNASLSTGQRCVLRFFRREFGIAYLWCADLFHFE